MTGWIPRQRCLLINKNIWTVKNRKDFVSAGPESRWEQSINFSQRMNVFRKLSSRQVERVTLLQKTRRSSQLGTKQIALYMHVNKIETYKSCAHANRLRCFTSETCLLWHSCINFSALWRCKCFPLLLVHGMFFQSAVWTLIHAFFHMQINFHMFIWERCACAVSTTRNSSSLCYSNETLFKYRQENCLRHINTQPNHCVWWMDYRRACICTSLMLGPRLLSNRLREKMWDRIPGKANKSGNIHFIMA